MKYFVYAFGSKCNELGRGFEFECYSSRREAVNARKDFIHSSLRKYGESAQSYADDGETTDYTVCDTRGLAEALLDRYGSDISHDEEACEKYMQFVRMLAQNGG